MPNPLPLPITKQVWPTKTSYIITKRNTIHSTDSFIGMTDTTRKVDTGGFAQQYEILVLWTLIRLIFIASIERSDQVMHKLSTADGCRCRTSVIETRLIEIDIECVWVFSWLITDYKVNELDISTANFPTHQRSQWELSLCTSLLKCSTFANRCIAIPTYVMCISIDAIISKSHRCLWFTLFPLPTSADKELGPVAWCYELEIGIHISVWIINKEEGSHCWSG